MTSVLLSALTPTSSLCFGTPDCVSVKKLENINCSADEVRRLLLKLKPKKSPGPDNIASCVLGECASELAPLMAHIKEIILFRFIT